MTYHVVLIKSVQKSLEKIDSRYQERIFAALAGLSNNPYLGKRLRGEYKNLLSYRVWPYRIIYHIVKRELVVIIVHIGHRQEVY